jgi:adenosine deaminase
MAEAGLTVTLNTDDPALFRTDMAQEFLIAARNFGFDRKKLGEVALNGLKISWLDEPTKRDWTAAWSKEIQSLLTNA